MKHSIKLGFLIVVAVSITAFGSLISGAHADVLDEISNKNEQIESLQRQINAFQAQVELSQGKSKTFQNEIYALNALISKVQLEIRSLQLSIEQTDSDIIETQSGILDAQTSITTHKEALGRHIQTLYEIDQKNLTHMLLQYDKLSDFFNNLQNVTDAQNSLQASINAIANLKENLEIHNEALEEQRVEYAALVGIQESQRINLSHNVRQQGNLLSATKGEEKKYQQLVNQNQRDISAIREQISYLQKHGISVNDALSFGSLAATRAGIRPAFLLALLDVESRLGENIGSGNWQDDMVLCYRRLGDIYYPAKHDHYYRRASTEENAFIRITNDLNIDPNSVKVSAEPTYGCGGAMGPAQFIPSTWLAYADRVAVLTGHNPPSPWSIEDSFTASAIKLAAGGADSKTRAGEMGAARAYIGGSTRCSSSICNYYSNLVLDKAAIIERSL